MNISQILVIKKAKLRNLCLYKIVITDKFQFTRYNYHIQNKNNIKQIICKCIMKKHA